MISKDSPALISLMVVTIFPAVWKCCITQGGLMEWAWSL